MIVGKLKDLKRYKGLNQNLDKAIDYICSANLYDLNLGKNYIDNENIFINRFNYIGQKEFDCFFEGHKNYLDIHIILNGKEKLGYSDISELNQVSKYDLENDFIKFEGPIKNYIDLKAGDFVITFPEDIHMPKISINDETIEKIVCKVLV
ncbi:YhcH/YjgK/YiaL family protein [Clostridium tertium]|uniref:YhcH/YjgK/YiaL family protein n=1 Tax=Clostridium tertium TaxID=1559 RepID=UPI00232D4611|nr:YhcH/YjgK/YiaL family protein [Clostridium tertium]MDB1924264.1 YhcH/YjgK/YiaL family protein [Clostridium tertium]MDB1927497.1 YhcH/YjgK/YiaL family protein [Clostridium tertium]MDB1931188.1 YhcH/YjgK/YiaL family protein [Clostridium tertium]